VELVDQRRMLWVGRFDELARGVGKIERDRDDLEALRL